MKPKKIKVIKPEPYYNIIFGCGNRQFYNVINKLWELWEESDINDDFNNGYYSEKCDYEGDLEKIIIYIDHTENENHNSILKLKPFIQKIFDYYGGSFEDLGDMNLVLSIY